VPPGPAPEGGGTKTRARARKRCDIREELLWRARDVFDWIRTGKLRIRINHELPLAKAGQAHRLLESRQTTGKILLIP